MFNIPPGFMNTFWGGLLNAGIMIVAIVLLNITGKDKFLLKNNKNKEKL